MNKLMQTVTENVAYVVIFLAVIVGDASGGCGAGKECPEEKRSF